MSFLNDKTMAVGMTTARWMALPECELMVVALTPTQMVIELRGDHGPDDVRCADPCIHVVRLGAVLYVQDGHHRLARARHNHEWMITGRVLDLTPTQQGRESINGDATDSEQPDDRGHPGRSNHPMEVRRSSRAA